MRKAAQAAGSLRSRPCQLFGRNPTARVHTACAACVHTTVRVRAHACACEALRGACVQDAAHLCVQDAAHFAHHSLLHWMNEAATRTRPCLAAEACSPSPCLELALLVGGNGNMLPDSFGDSSSSRLGSAISVAREAQTWPTTLHFPTPADCQGMKKCRGDHQRMRVPLDGFITDRMLFARTSTCARSTTTMSERTA